LESLILRSNIYGHHPSSRCRNRWVRTCFGSVLVY
jgi:hypothetical protein